VFEGDAESGFNDELFFSFDCGILVVCGRLVCEVDSGDGFKVEGTANIREREKGLLSATDGRTAGWGAD